MYKNNSVFKCLLALLVLCVGFSGCTVIFQKGRRSDIQRITELKTRLSELERAKGQLENRMHDEIGDKEVRIEMLERGLVITFLSEVLFDSGKSKLRTESFSKLDKVASVLKTTVSELDVGIEGHTDNVPIKHSKWKSNWELSSNRAMSVLHYLIDNHGIRPERLSGTGYGEYKPVASNSSPKGRQQNRRVEIVILPKIEKAAGQVPSPNYK